MKTEKSAVKEGLRCLTLVLVFMHTFLYHYKNFSSELFYPEDEKQPKLFMQLLLYIMLMGGTFVALSGFSKPMINISRVLRGTSDVKQICYSDFVYGVQLITVDRLFAFFFCPVNGILFKKLMKQEISSMYELKMSLYLVDSLFCMGCCSILTSVITFIFLAGVERSNLINRLKWMQALLFIIATAVLYGTPTVRKWGFAYVNKLIEEKKYICAMFVNFLCGDYYPLFPYIAHYCYSYYGGISFAMKNSKNVMIFFFIYGWFLFLLGLYLIKTHWRLGVYMGMYFEFSERGMDYRSFLQFSQFGMMVWIFCLSVILTSDFGEVIYDKNNKNKNKTTSKKEKGYQKQQNNNNNWSTFLELNNVGKIPLTIFVFESVLKAFVHFSLNEVLIPNFFPFLKDWDYSFPCIVIFGFFNIFLWVSIIKVWKRINFIFSLDWTLMKIVEITTGKKSSKFE